MKILREITLGNSANHAGYLGGRLCKVSDQGVDRVYARCPAAPGVAYCSSLGDLSFLSNYLAYPPEFRRKHAVLVYDLVQLVVDLADNSALRRHAARKIPIADST